MDSNEAKYWIFFERDLKVSLRIKLFIFCSVVFLGSFFVLKNLFIEDIRTQYKESTEASMVDLAYFLASTIEASDLPMNTQGLLSLQKTVENLKKKKIEAFIYGKTKNNVDMSFYITDSNGIVLFDSRGESLHKDFSLWNDVFLTLKGQYGARSSDFENEEGVKNPALVVAAPIGSDPIKGVVSVMKPISDLKQFINETEEKIQLSIILFSLFLFLFLLLVSHLFSRPVGTILKYAKELSKGIHVTEPKILSKEFSSISAGITQLKRSLDGKVENEKWMRFLNHEIKSPLTVIKSSVEFLEDEKSEEKRSAYLKDIDEECQHIEKIVNKSLDVTKAVLALKSENFKIFSVDQIVRELIEEFSSVFKKDKIHLEVNLHKTSLLGSDFFFKQALRNILQNSLNHGVATSEIQMTLKRTESKNFSFKLVDNGGGVSGDKLPKLFDRFTSFSFKGESSSGFGLPFVKEVCQAHSLTVQAKNTTVLGKKGFCCEIFTS